MSLNGSCLCGAVRFTLNGQPKGTLSCFCSDCRKGSGHLGQLLAHYDSKDVEIHDDKKALKEYVVTATKSGFPKRKLFCGDCGCTLLTIPMKHHGEMYMVRSTLLDGEGVWEKSFAPAKAIFGDDKNKYLGESNCEYI